MMGLLNVGFNGGTTVYPPAKAIPSAQVCIDGIVASQPDPAFLAPPFLEGIAQEPKLLEDLSKSLSSVAWAGGDLPLAVGEKIVEKVRIWTGIGGTEFGTIPPISRRDDWPSEEWKYVTFHPDFKCEFHHVSEDLYEMVIIRHPDPEKLQPVFTMFSDLQEYRTGDLYSPHAFKPNLWTHSGRNDDIVVFLTGEKLNPTMMEQQISQHPDIAVVLVVGDKRPEAALLIELASKEPLSAERRERLFERLWPIIERVNQDCPQYARISKHHIIFIDPERPMERTPKGTIRRRRTVKAYEKEIDALFPRTNHSTSPSPATLQTEFVVMSQHSAAARLSTTMTIC